MHFTGHHFEQAAVGKLHLRNFICVVTLIARVHHFFFGRQIYPQLKAVHLPAKSHHVFSWQLAMNYTRAGRHPLHTAWFNHSACACGVFVHHGARK